MNIKPNKKLMLAATIITMLNFQSCSKYEDGPAFSLTSKTFRLVGEWEVEEVKGTDEYDDEVTLTIEFEKDGDFSFGYSYDGYSYSYDGEWKWESGKDEIEVEIDGLKTEWEILRLTNDELWFEDEDGYEWRCEKN